MQDAELLIPIGLNLCFSSMLSGDFQRVIHVAPTISRLIEGCQARPEYVAKPFRAHSYVLAAWGVSTAISGDFAHGQRLLESALSTSLQTGDPGTVGFIEMIYGVTYGIRGDGHSAATLLKNAIKHLEESQSTAFLGSTWAMLGWAHFLMGEFKTAVGFTEKGLKMNTDYQVPYWRSLCHWFCSLAHFAEGGLEVAQVHAMQALKCSQENHERQIQGFSMAWLGRVFAKTDITQIEAAEKHILRGISLLEELQIRSHSGWGYLWLGEVYQEAGRREEALASLKKAESMFQEMGMDYWLGKARDALATI
jgi:ATP/maltotriose-dependent transcriptional regulator MalT